MTNMEFRISLSEKLNLRACIKGRKFKKMNWTVYWIFLAVNMLIGPTLSQRSWQRAGCFRIGHSRVVQIPGCLEFNITTNACRGFCESYAIPSSPRTMYANNQHILTSRAECCSIQETHDVPVSVRCVGGVREFTFKSAKQCACSICRGG